jgi:hypothetical protein
VGKVAFKRRVIPLKGNHVFAPPYASRLSTFQAPDGELPQSFRLVVGGTHLRGSWYLSAIVRLQGCSSSVLGRGVRRVGVGPCAGGGPLLPSVIGGEGVRRSWRWQLPRAWLSDPSGFGAASGAAFRHGSRKRFLRRRDSQCRPRTDLQLYDLLPVLASRVRAWVRALWQQHPP